MLMDNGSIWRPGNWLLDMCSGIPINPSYWNVQHVFFHMFQPWSPYLTQWIPINSHKGIANMSVRSARNAFGSRLLNSLIDLIWFDLIWFDLIWFDLIWLINVIWFDLIWLIDWCLSYSDSFWTFWNHNHCSHSFLPPSVTWRYQLIAQQLFTRPLRPWEIRSSSQSFWRIWAFHRCLCPVSHRTRQQKHNGQGRERCRADAANAKKTQTSCRFTKIMVRFTLPETKMKNLKHWAKGRWVAFLFGRPAMLVFGSVNV